jgi:hypothetical protein
MWVTWNLQPAAFRKRSKNLICFWQSGSYPKKIVNTSQLIALLENSLALHGDIPVFFDSADGLTDVTSVELHESPFLDFPPILVIAHDHAD